MHPWVKNSVVYQIYPRSFNDSNSDGIGDLQGIICKLDYLVELGINTIWLSPIYESPCDDNGYDISHYQSILKDFGTMEDFDYLLAECHKRDIKLVMDLVINHCSDEHEWFVESRKSRDNPYSDYFHWVDEPNSWKSVFGGSAWEWCKERQQYYLHIFSKKQPDLNWSNKNLRDEINAMITWWLDKGVDGFRVDAISFLEKPQDFANFPDQDVFATLPCNNEKVGHEYIRSFMEQIHQRGAFSVGEINAVNTDEVLRYTLPERGEFQMSIVFVPPEVEVFHSDLIGYYKQQIERRIQLQQQGVWDAVFLSNHDKPRQVSLFGNDEKYWQQSAKALAVLNLTQYGTPFLYQGEEIGMTNCYFDTIEQYNDIDTVNKYNELIQQGHSANDALETVKVASRDNARTPMQWNGGQYAGFSDVKPWLDVNINKDQINVSSQEADESSILNFYKKLLGMRKESNCLKFGRTVLLPSHPKVIMFERLYEEEKITVTINLSDETQAVNYDFSRCEHILGQDISDSIEPFGYSVCRGV
ncbi:glycosyl hydrolase family protein [Vibrio ichthyoenteri ATCC 700023]|uniref:Glycosyl hydrolase family protein n=1 Tax=Vibrio ichthyoenteri ATCC 700023 TaxID=870968 RepID=F9RYS2_9VIBR|nr:alpha-glucosidase [Vibrio ichthyoenteri]EGU46282.1 glycosyl hydrolase family protein [Vibrio ichthyoenteri ATCC 700023]